ncbi:MAG: hypothetical protein ACRDND_08885 [Streptosporangiaceae bacterium]
MPAKPVTLESYYVQASAGMNTTAFTDGCAQGLRAEDAAVSNGTTAFTSAFLDFGAQTGNGTETLTPRGQNATLTSGDIHLVAEEFADGFALCADELEIIPIQTAYLQLFLGTNTSGATPTAAYGQTWGNSIVAPVETYATHNDGGWVSVAGASDIETEFSTPASAQAWVTGYGNSHGGLMLDYGDAGGCPPAGATCNNGWTQADVIQVAWGDTPSVPAPEIYSDANSPLNTGDVNAQQWAQLCSVSAGEPASLNSFGAIQFWGPLDQFPLDSSDADGLGNTATQSWTDLWNDLNGPSGTAACHQTPTRSLEQNTFPAS